MPHIRCFYNYYRGDAALIRAEKARRKLNKEAYARFRRQSKMYIKKTAARIFLIAAAELFICLTLFRI